MKRGDIAFVVCLFIGVVFGYYIDNFIPGIVAGIGNGMSSKEISVLLNIEVDSINKQRTRIRNKMNLTRNQNLTTSLQKL